MASGTLIKAFPWKQTSPVQMCAQTCVDVGYTNMGLCEAVPYANQITAAVKILRSITNAPWYVSNCTLHNDLHIPLVATEINRLSLLYHKRLIAHHNTLITAMAIAPTIVRRLKTQWPTDLFDTTERESKLVSYITRLWFQKECHCWMTSPFMSHTFNTFTHCSLKSIL